MKRFLIVSAIMVMSAITATADETALEIIRNADRAQRTDSQKTETTMRTYTSEKNEKDFREFRMTSYSRGADSSMEFVEPRSIKGLKILSIGDDTWLFFPSTGRVRKIAGTSKGDSVQGVGGDFSYEDMGGGTFDEKYNFTIVSSDSQSWTLEGKAKGTDPVYDKITLQVTKAAYLPSRIEYYTNKDGHIKTMVMSEVKDMGGRVMPTVVTMTNHKKGSKTVIRTLSADYSAVIPDKVFNPTQFYR
jgi:hypothetical protein